MTMILGKKEYINLMAAKLIKGPANPIRDGQIIIEVNGCQIARDWDDETEMLPCMVDLCMDHFGGFDNKEIRDACCKFGVEFLNAMTLSRTDFEDMLVSFMEGYETALKNHGLIKRLSWRIPIIKRHDARN